MQSLHPLHEVGWCSEARRQAVYIWVSMLPQDWMGMGIENKRMVHRKLLQLGGLLYKWHILIRKGSGAALQEEIN